MVDAAAGWFDIHIGPKFYKDLPVDYYRVEAEDNSNTNLSIFFYPVAQYVRAALNSPSPPVHVASLLQRSQVGQVIK